MKQNIVKVFVSHTTADVAHVRCLEKELKKRDEDGRLQIWIYETETGPNRDLGLLKVDIEEADFLIVALSKKSMAAPFVQRELGHAWQLASNNEDGRPVILGVWIDTEEPPKPMVMSMRRFDPKRKRSFRRKYDFGASRYYKLYNSDIDDLGDLYNYIAPRVRFWGHDIHTSAELTELGVWNIYKTFFPNKEERDDPAHIIGWIEDENAQRSGDHVPWQESRTNLERITKQNANDWGSVFGVIQIAGRAVGMVYLTVHARSGWVFGNYFGVLKSWRVNHRAAYFIKEIRAHTEKYFGQLKGVLFEVERFEEAAIVRLSEKLQRLDPPRSRQQIQTSSSIMARFMKFLLKLRRQNRALSKPEIETIRAVMRIGLYQKYKVRFLVGPEGRDIVYRQPVMNKPDAGEQLSQEWLRDHEWPLWIMVWPFSLTDVVNYDFNEIIDFFYLDLFGSYYEKLEPVFQRFDRSYAEYLLNLRDEILSKNDRRAFGVLDLPKRGDEVWSLSLQKNLSIKL